MTHAGKKKDDSLPSVPCWNRIGPWPRHRSFCHGQGGPSEYYCNKIAKQSKYTDDLPWVLVLKNKQLRLVHRQTYTFVRFKLDCHQLAIVTGQYGTEACCEERERERERERDIYIHVPSLV